jgi:hypothetical protein
MNIFASPYLCVRLHVNKLQVENAEHIIMKADKICNIFKFL